MSAPTAPVETPAPAPEAPQEETQTPPATEPVVEESAAPVEEPAAELQVSAVEPEKPDYMTRADWEREKSEVAQRAAAEALELDRRRRQTENARRANDEKRAAEDRLEARDTVKAAFGAAGVFEIPDESVYTAIDRVASKKAQSLTSQVVDTADTAMDYFLAQLEGKPSDLDDSFEPMARRLAPKVQAMFNLARPQIEEAARKDYIHKDELPKHVEAEIARRAAQKREGTTELQRVEGAPAPTIDTSTVEYWDTRIAHAGEDGFPHLTPDEFATARKVRAAAGIY